MRVGELHAAALDADDDQVVGAVVELDDLVGHALERAIHGARIEDDVRLGSHSVGQYVLGGEQ